jgi:N-ethylmaleimide reductase
MPMNIQEKPPREASARGGTLFSPWRLGPIELRNRIVMAPMTRSRADAAGVQPAIAATYYAQRASGGLLVTEATHVSTGGGFFHTPGLQTAAQVEGWKPVTEAVHRAGGRIYVQLWHVGRTSHPDLIGGLQPIGPSAIACGGDVRVSATERKPRGVPRALEVSEIRRLVEDFHRGAVNAKAAGFDGIELHGANGYLVDQFTRDGANQRTDEYGGSIANRCRFGLEVTRALIDGIGADRVGYRISPTFGMSGMSDSDPLATFTYLASELGKLGIAYLHIHEPITDTNRMTPKLRPSFPGTTILCGAFSADSANAAIDAGETDLVAFGASYLANPDLPRRLQTGAPLNEPDKATYYTAGEKGYLDYPTLG